MDIYDINGPGNSKSVSGPEKQIPKIKNYSKIYSFLLINKVVFFIKDSPKVCSMNQNSTFNIQKKPNLKLYYFIFKKKVYFISLIRFGIYHETFFKR